MATGWEMAFFTRRRSIRIFLPLVYKVFGDGAAMIRFIQAVIGAGSCMLLAAAGMALFGSVGSDCRRAAGHLSSCDISRWPARKIGARQLFHRRAAVSAVGPPCEIPGISRRGSAWASLTHARKCAPPRRPRPGVVLIEKSVWRQQSFLPAARWCCCLSARATTRLAEDSISPRRSSVRTSTSAITPAREVSTSRSFPGAAMRALNGRMPLDWPRKPPAAR